MFYDVLVKLCFSVNYLHFYESNSILGHVFGLSDQVKEDHEKTYQELQKK